MPTYQRSTVHTSDDIRAIVESTGSHFFDRSTMSYFSSRLLSGVYAADGDESNVGARFFFVTSERDTSPYQSPQPRLYSVRRLTLATVRDDRPDVLIDTMGEFQGFATAREARRFAELCAAVIIVARDENQGEDGDMAEAIAWARNTLTENKNAPIGACTIEDDGTVGFAAYRAVLRATDADIAMAIAAVS